MKINWFNFVASTRWNFTSNKLCGCVERFLTFSNFSFVNGEFFYVRLFVDYFTPYGRKRRGGDHRFVITSCFRHIRRVRSIRIYLTCVRNSRTGIVRDDRYVHRTRSIASNHPRHVHPAGNGWGGVYRVHDKKLRYRCNERTTQLDKDLLSFSSRTRVCTHVIIVKKKKNNKSILLRL